MTKAEHLDSARSWVVWAASLGAYLIAVTQRTSFGVAGLEATDRFDASASILATFSVVQLVVYAGLQIPVGILVDRWGPRAMITGGAALMIVGQFLLAMADSVASGLVGRFFVGAGDAMTFVSVIRLLPIWFSGYRIPMLTQVTGMIGQLGQLLSLIPFVALLHLWSWTPAFLSLAALSVVGFALALVLVSNGPRTDEAPPAPVKARTLLAGAWREPGTRLGFWTHFTTQFTTNVFLLTWGYPFLVSGQGVSPAVASGLLSIFVVVALLAGPLLGAAVARHPHRRSAIAFNVIGMIALTWLVVILWPGRAPIWMLVILIVCVALGGPASMIGFDFVRTFNPAHVIGTATGIVNVGGFLAALVTVYVVGWLLDIQQRAAGAGAELYSLDAFRWALSFQFVVMLGGIIGMVVTRNKARRAMALRGEYTPRSQRRQGNISGNQ
ncbi:MFS transporter [Paeniglutamicibacter psychrophenolicus]|uniref:MFS transporter n=1 Tax=Paeniglutamicibacter psychrophenolicus TaxID=257454 RepID=UPI002785294F|nr:MFS transporter [Paeniglutamicibacter psychrophenolicus]MDQ0094431.1 MFS family permease [Paeniglutamicibacter psychrophenolicus]